MKKVIYSCLLLLAIGCQNTSVDISMEQQKIIETLKKETQYFCERNLEKWQAQWSHQPFVSKMYAGKTEFENLEGWEAINQFVVRHLAENPQAIPLPETNFDYDIYLFGETAWVFYSKNVDSTLVKETRFMVKENEKWKIARMQTIY